MGPGAGALGGGSGAGGPPSCPSTRELRGHGKERWRTGTVPGPRDNPHIADWQWDHHRPITLSPRQVSGSCRPGGWVSLPIQAPWAFPGRPGQAPPGAVQRNHPAWRKEDLQLLGGLPRAWRPLGWLPGPSSDVTFSGSPSPDPPGFPPSHCGIYLLAWRPSLLWGLRTQSSTHCCVPSTWHTVGALQTLPNEWTHGW